VTPPEIELFSTCPPSNRVEQHGYLDRVRNVARWSEDAGCRGMLVYTDNGLVDPWLVAQHAVASTSSLSPLVAVQPIYMHPYTVAKLVATVGHLYGRRLHVNFVAGGFRNDLLALDDPTPHDERYDRLVEYGLIVKALLADDGPVSFDGRYYSVRNLRMRPPLDPELSPGLMLSGSSEAGRRAAAALGAVAVSYPGPAEGIVAAETDGRTGIRIGIVARDDDEEAWRVAWERFPADRQGQIAHALAMKVTDSAWHRQLSAEEGAGAGSGPYWLHPFQNYKTFCPYLVGSYAEVGAELRRYLDAGVSTIILDVPTSPEEFEHVRAALAQAGRDGDG
jgi:alkanesulfonate monooxygenase